MKAVASSTITISDVPFENGEGPAKSEYRIKKPFAVVHFEHAEKGRIVLLPEGAKLRVVGSSCLRECFEVLCENRRYNIFKTDLLGPWSHPVKSSPINPARIVAAAAGARA
jgi:hypothetical protein